MFFQQTPRQEIRSGDPLASLPAKLAMAEPLANEMARVVYAYLHMRQARVDFDREILPHTLGFENDAEVMNSYRAALAEYDAEAHSSADEILESWQPAKGYAQ